jgi:hypothetical protein
MTLSSIFLLTNSCLAIYLAPMYPPNAELSCAGQMPEARNQGKTNQHQKLAKIANH